MTIPLIDATIRERNAIEEAECCILMAGSFLGKERSLDKEEEGVLKGSLVLLGTNCLRAADCDLADWNFSTTELTASPNNPV